MRYKSEWYRGRAPSPVDSTHILIRKTVTKEKTSNWDWGRASQASSVSSILEAPRSASPLKVAFFRSSSRPRSRSRHHRSSSHTRHHTYHNHYHDDDQDDFHSRAHRQSADEHRHHRRHSRRYSESAPRAEEKGVVHTQKSSQRRHKHSLPVASHQLCPPPILLAVAIRPSRKMEETGGFTYEEWCKRRECVAVPTETIAPKSSISNRSNNTRHSEVSDQENAYRYVPMREPGPQDAVVSFLTKDLWRKKTYLHLISPSHTPSILSQATLTCTLLSSCRPWLPLLHQHPPRLSLLLQPTPRRKRHTTITTPMSVYVRVQFVPSLSLLPLRRSPLPRLHPFQPFPKSPWLA